MNTPRIPQGQVETTRFPPVGERESNPQTIDLERWRLYMDGCVQHPTVWSWADIMALPQYERTVDIHCVTGWSRLETSFTGFPLATLLDICEPRAEAQFVRFEAYSARKHDTSLPLSVVQDDTWLIHSIDGKPLAPRHGYPLRTLTPSRWFYKSLKWVHRIELLTEDKLGFWERESGYHNNADPWADREERYIHGTLSRPMLERFKKTKRMDRYRGHVILHADLSGWNPIDRDLHSIQLKNCNLSGANLRGTNLRGANLTRCNLRGADLRNADLRGADLEGAELAEADLRGADMREAFLTAASFYTRLNPLEHPARIEGLRLEGAQGLLEHAEAFLNDPASR